jgi:hypothetical protein
LRCSVGIAARYAGSARWFERALAENPAAIAINRNVTPAFALAGRKQHARRSFAKTRPSLSRVGDCTGVSLAFGSSFSTELRTGLESVGIY